MHPGKPIYTVSLLSKEVKKLLEASYINIQVEGEISGLTRPASGHQYFNLKDQNAQLRCVFFKHSARLSPVSLNNGMQVILSVRVSLYEQRGDFQLIVQAAVSAGEGLLRKKFEQLKARLGGEGLFDTSYKKTLPSAPARVGVITSASGAAIHDIISVFKRRYPGIDLLIYPTLVQGELARNDIVSAIKSADQRNECDVLIVGRGGGSLEDLWPFNEEDVARAVFACNLPIVSAVGHESDFTICDMVADARAATPSAAAEMLSPDIVALSRLHSSLHMRISNAYIRQHEKSAQQLDHAQRRLSAYKQKISQIENYFDSLEKRLNFSFVAKLERKQQHLYAVNKQIHKPDKILERIIFSNKNLNTRLINSMQNQNTSRLLNFSSQKKRLTHHLPDRIIEHKKFQHCLAEQRLWKQMPDILSNKQNLLKSTAYTLQALSPLQTLSRGYASLQNENNKKIISSVTQATAGDSIQANLQDGQLHCTVNKVVRTKND